MAEKKEFGALLKELRGTAKMTLKELADRSGLTMDGIVKLEQGRRRPSWDTVLALSKALGVTCEAFTS